MTRKAFPVVAEKYGFSADLYSGCIKLLRELEYGGKITPFADYSELDKLPCDKFLVTAGFLKLQQSKKRLGVGPDFKKVFIVDTVYTDETKKSKFEDIRRDFGYEPNEILVIATMPDQKLLRQRTGHTGAALQ